MATAANSANSTGSFENQTASSASGGRTRTRKRGIAATLLEVTNILDGQPSTRLSKDKAVSAIAVTTAYSTEYKPRGTPREAGIISGKKRKLESSQDADEATCGSSLCQIVKHNPQLYNKGKECISTHITKNATIDMQKAFAIRFFTTAVDELGFNITEAAKFASAATGFSAERVRKWAFSFFTAVGGSQQDVDAEFVYEELSSDRGNGCGNQSYIIHDEDFRLQAREYVRSNCSKKGEPNLMALQFRDWIEATFGVKVCNSTATLWLHHLGFTQKNHMKGVFFDGHDREDVANYRSKLLETLDELDKKTIVPNGPPPQLQEGEKPHIRVVHDESTFYANADQSRFWSDGYVEPLRQKSLGQSIMVSDFIVEGHGYLRDEQQEARLLLETKTDGYFQSEKFLAQVDKALDIFERKYPGHVGIFLFDNAPCHKKTANDALNVQNMNVNPGGKQAVMKDTKWDGQVQPMVLPDGRPKGMKLVLEERGVDTSGMKAEKMREVLGKHPDFLHQRTMLQDKVESRGHVCMYLPKYHCELNPIERNWCHAKKYTRAHCNGSIVRLRRIVPESLETVTEELMAKFFVTCRDYERAYKEGHTGNGVMKALKVYKSHRRIFNINE